jgi:hypothetical protein
MKYIFLIFVFLTNGAVSSPSKNCEELQPDADEIFQELAYKAGIVCIYSTIENNEYVTITFFEKTLENYNKIAKNNTLIQLQDMQSQQPIIDSISDDHFQLIHQFPRDTYVIELESADHSIKITHIHKSIRLNSLTAEETPLLVNFSANEEKLESMSFDTLDQNQAFNNETLELASSSGGKIIPITTEKAMLFIKPDAKHRSNSYLIKGDKIMLLEAKGKWLLVRYTNKKNISIDRWIMLSDIL